MKDRSKYDRKRQRDDEDSDWPKRKNRKPLVEWDDGDDEDESE